MNSNTHNQTSNNLPLSTSIIIPTHLVIHYLSTISNPSAVDFERLSQQYAQFFFYLLDQQHIYHLKTSNKNIISYILTQNRLHE